VRRWGNAERAASAGQHRGVTNSPARLTLAAAGCERSKTRGRAGIGAAPWQMLTGLYRWTGPEAWMSTSKAIGGLVWLHWPWERARTNKDVQPEPPVAADPGVPAGPAQQLVPCWLTVPRQVRGLKDIGATGSECLSLIVPLRTSAYRLCCWSGRRHPRGEHAPGDHRGFGRRLRGGHELETLDLFEEEAG
jgi:hypothetical protein